MMDRREIASSVDVKGGWNVKWSLVIDIPVGRYVISLTFSNEGYSKDVDNCFTIIVK